MRLHNTQAATSVIHLVQIVRSLGHVPVASRPRVGSTAGIGQLGRNQLDRHSWTGTSHSHQTGPNIVRHSTESRRLPLFPSFLLLGMTVEEETGIIPRVD